MSVTPGSSARSPQRLARFLPELESPRVLELGCGTGLFSRHLVQRYQQGHFVLTDVAPAMIAACRRNLAPSGAAHISYEVMDAGEAGGHEGLDLIVSSMTLHWLADPVASLERLRRLLAPGGLLLYATLGPDSFAEWREALASEGLPSGLPDIPCASRRGRRGARWRPMQGRSRSCAA